MNGFWVFLAIIAVFFVGEPDLLDVIISHLSGLDLVCTDTEHGTNCVVETPWGD